MIRLYEKPIYALHRLHNEILETHLTPLFLSNINKSFKVFTFTVVTLSLEDQLVPQVLPPETIGRPAPGCLRGLWTLRSSFLF